MARESSVPRPAPSAPHLGKSEVAVDEQGVEADVAEVGENRHGHLHARVADPFEELLEGEEEHQEGHAVDQHVVVGDGHVDHLDGLPEAVEQRCGGILQRSDGEAQRRVEEDAVVEQPGRTLALPAGVELADEGRKSQRDPHGRDEEDEEDRAAKRYGGQRRGVLTAVAADHQVVGHLGENLSHLGQHDGEGQPQVSTVLLLVCCESVHASYGSRAAKVRIILPKTDHPSRFVPARIRQRPDGSDSRPAFVTSRRPVSACPASTIVASQRTRTQRTLQPEARLFELNIT